MATSVTCALEARRCRCPMATEGGAAGRKLRCLQPTEQPSPAVRKCAIFGWKHGRLRALNRRQFMTLIGGAAAWPLTARAQQGGRGRRIVALMSMAADDPEAQPRVAAFESGLRAGVAGWTRPADRVSLGGERQRSLA